MGIGVYRDNGKEDGNYDNRYDVLLKYFVLEAFEATSIRSLN